MLDVRTLPKLTQPELASLIVLMAAARELTNPQLKELAGIELNGKARRTLNDLKLVESRKLGRGLAHQITDEGWLVCRDLLAAAERPARAGSLGGALFVVLAGIGAGLDRRGLSPQQFFDPRHTGGGTESTVESTAESATGPAAVRAAHRTEQPAIADPAVLEGAIRDAYAGLASADGDWVGLAPLRAGLGAFTRTEVDEALLPLARQRGVHIIPVANLKSLTQLDRDAALRLGGQDCHALAIEAG